MERLFDSSLKFPSEQSRSVVERYYEARDDPRPWDFEYANELILPYPYEVVWQLVLETQHMGLWLDQRYSRERSLDQNFGRGFQINSSEMRTPYSPTFLVDVEETRYTQRAEILVQRPFYTDYPAYYFRLKVGAFERYSTKFSIHASSSTKTPPPAPPVALLRSIFGGRPPSPGEDPFVRELSRAVDDALQRFSYFCHDRTVYGPVKLVDEYKSDSSWYTRPNSGMAIHFYPGRDGATAPRVGEFIKAKERIGFVAPVTASGDLAEWKENYYVSPGQGYVRDLLKKCGDEVRRGERVLLLSQEMDTDLSVTPITIDNSQISPIDFGNSDLELYKCQLKEGQEISVGETVALAKPRYSKDTIVEIRSNYDGVIVEEPSADLSSCLALLKVSAFSEDWGR